MQITYEVELDYGDDTPEGDIQSPSEPDIEAAIANGLRAAGLSSPATVIAKRQ